jgi:hypothetical protein
MKHSLSFLIAILLSVALHAQDTYYKGEWSKATNACLFSCLIHLSVNGNIVSGEIFWTFKAADSTNADQVASYKGKKNRSAVEYIKGTYNNSTGCIYFEGDHKDDYHNIIGLDKYTVKLSDGKDVIYGKTWSNGNEDGLLYALKKDALTCQREIMSLKKKIGQ